VVEYLKNAKEKIFKNPDIYIVSSDKWNKIVAISKESYHQKLDDLLSDGYTLF
jgi:hypothetical protein